MEVVCFKCQAHLKFADQIGFREECPQCRSDVRVCKNCEFYDAKSYNECREPQSDRVQEKERSNRCDFFRPRSGTMSVASERDQLKAAAEALFKKKN